MWHSETLSFLVSPGVFFAPIPHPRWHPGLGHADRGCQGCVANTTEGRKIGEREERTNDDYVISRAMQGTREMCPSRSSLFLLTSTTIVWVS